MATETKTVAEKKAHKEAREAYTGGEVEVVKGLAHVRMRPSMYIGSQGLEGLHHLVEEVLNNCVDEAIGGFASNIWVIINDDGSITIKDDGRGIPIDEHPKEKKPTLEVILTEMGAGAKFGGGAYKISGGLHGMGVSVVNACAEWLEIISYRQGHEWKQRYEKGVPVTKLIKGAKTEKLGTDITFAYDNTVLEEGLKLSYEKIVLRLQEFSYLVAKLRLNLISPDHKERVFYSEGGLKDYVSHLIAEREKVHPVHKETISFTGEEVEVAFRWTDNNREQALSFTNCINNVDGGTHTTGFRAALTRTLNNYATRLGKIKANQEALSGEDVREGVFSVINVKVADPQFESQTKVKLNNPETKQIVEKFVAENLEQWFNANDKEGKKILARCLEARDGRIAAQKAKQAVSKRKGLLGGDNTLPGKLSDCSLDDPTITELYICEGDSAGGSGKVARDPQIQAILPLRGKIINAEKEGAARLWANNEIRDIVAAAGGTIEGQGTKVVVKLENPRYGKIIIATDADVDGKHINTLLLTFFYREMPQLIASGSLYVAVPPLYGVETKKHGRVYLFTDEALEKRIKGGDVKLVNGAPDVTRFKGLGEMNADQLRETVMDPENRIIKRVTIDDAAAAEQITTLLMGKNVAGRKKFIEDNALDVEVIV